MNSPLSLGREKASKLRRPLLTPEGVKLNLELAHRGDRAGAFAVDSAIIGLALVLMSLLGSLIWSDPDAGYARTVMQLFFFLLLNFYFMLFELKWSGVTPGKRVFGMRVIDRGGGQLTADAIVVRNFMRQVEVFIPLSVILAPEMLWPGATGWAKAVAILWALGCMLLPLFNKDHLRIGDLVAGTTVVLSPKTVLMPDLEATRQVRGSYNIGGMTPAQQEASPATNKKGYIFAAEHLSHYGVYELQVLEDFLRKDEEIGRYEAVETISGKIQRKIGWKPPAGHKVNHSRFLQDFYSAQRALLEEKMLFGKKREDKFSPKQ